MRVRSQRLLFAHILGQWLLALTTYVAPALAQVPEKHELSEPPAQFVFGSVQCPDPKLVQQAVLGLIPPERYPLVEHGVRVELEDLGDSYRVTVLKDGTAVKKSYSDPARDCDGRARFAAVFAVLTLMPPELGAEAVAQAEPKPKVEPAPKPAPAPASAPALPPLVRLELSALYAHAPAMLEAPSLHSFGGELRVAVGRGTLSGTLSLAYTQRAHFDLYGVQGDITRLPMSLGARLRSDFDSWSLTADLGLLLVAQNVRGTNLLTQQSSSSLDVGARAGVQIARKVGPHFALFLGAFVWFSPAPSEISALPQGVIGNLPYFWLGGAAGVSFGL
ncbi:MAG: hypothetical protein WDO69_27260 [Pseudomonadota bacterium]